MPIAAVPAYLGKDFKDASPGMRFSMYLKLWGINRRTQAVLWQTHDLDYEVRGQNQREREIKCENKVPALTEAKCLTNTDKKVMSALSHRQQQVFNTVASDEATLRLDARATAPFTTGLGNEHPLENGFAFLNPYGLPYLPGSGVKGVLRQSARELASGAWGDAHGWSVEEHYEVRVANETTVLSMLDVLFGLESEGGDTTHIRGALFFWDVIPQIEDDSLMVEVMTPHQSHYYQRRSDPKSGGSTNPHDSGQPTPISFLTVPPGSGFRFFVTCDTAHISRFAPGLLRAAPGADRSRWQMLMTAAFEHAFQWLGFGAKTAVGYGAMAQLSAEEVAAARATAEQVARKCGWVDETLKRLVGERKGKNENEALRGKPLAEAWRGLPDASLKEKALVDIKARWQAEGWWENPPGKAARQAKTIYDDTK